MTCLPNSTRYVYQCICSIQESKTILVSVHEPLLDVHLLDWEEPSKDRFMLEPQYPHRILLCNIPYLVLVEDHRADNFGHAIEKVRYYPIEHLNHEWEFLQYSTVKVVGKS